MALSSIGNRNVRTPGLQPGEGCSIHPKAATWNVDLCFTIME